MAFPKKALVCIAAASRAVTYPGYDESQRPGARGGIGAPEGGGADGPVCRHLRARAGRAVARSRRRGPERRRVPGATALRGERRHRGFSEKDAAGRSRGLEADFCRALAPAVLGDADRGEFVALPVPTEREERQKAGDYQEPDCPFS